MNSLSGVQLLCLSGGLRDRSCWPLCGWFCGTAQAPYPFVVSENRRPNESTPSTASPAETRSAIVRPSDVLGMSALGRLACRAMLWRRGMRGELLAPVN